MAAISTTAGKSGQNTDSSGLTSVPSGRFGNPTEQFGNFSVDSSLVQQQSHLVTLRSVHPDKSKNLRVRSLDRITEEASEHLEQQSLSVRAQIDNIVYKNIAQYSNPYIDIGVSNIDIADPKINNSSGEMIREIKFTVFKAAGKIFFRRYRFINDKTWHTIKEEYQDQSHHQAVLKQPGVLDAIQIARYQKSFDVTLNEEDQKPYFHGTYDVDGDEPENDDDDDNDEDNGQKEDTAKDTDPSQAEASAPPLNIDTSKIDPNLLAIMQMFENKTNKILESLVNQNKRKPQKMEVNKFSGVSEDPATWIATYEKACTVNGWTSDLLKVHNMKAYLEGAAESWYSNRVQQNKPDIYSDWKESLINAFKQNRIESARSALKWCYRDGPILEYFYHKQKLLRMAFPHIDDYTFISLVLMGLPDNMQNQAMQNDLDSQDDLLRALERLKKISKQFDGKNKKSESKDEYGARGGKFDRKWEKKGEKKVPHPSASAGKSNTTTDEKQAMSCIEYETCNQVTKLSKLPMVKFKINGQIMDCLIDSGSSINMINSKMYCHIGNQIDESDKRILVGFNGSKTSSAGTVKLIISNINKSEESNIVASVVEGLEFDFIVGYVSFDKLGIKLNWPDALPPNCPQSPLTDQVSTVQGSVLTKDGIKVKYPKLCNPNKEPMYFVDFQLKEDHKIVKDKPYRMSRERYIYAEGKCDEMKRKLITMDSNSDWASPSLMVPKENGELRFCVDYRKINEETELDPFPFPVIDEVICNFGGCKYFSKIDLKDGFWNIGLTKETTKFTAFVTPFGHYEFLRLPFGWKNSPPKFQRIITSVLGELLADRKVCCYIDDIIVGSESIDGLMELTNKVLKRLEENNFTINLDKSMFCVEAVTFLGRKIDGYTKTTKEESVEKVRKMARPYDVHTVRVFTGLASHFRGFIKDFAKLIRPIDQLKQKDVPFNWSEECESAFHKIKDIISSNPVLQLPDWNLPFELCTDASDKGSGSILYQRDKNLKRNQQLRVIGYQSYTFTKPEQNYSVTDKEGLGVIKAIKYFRSYLESRPFKVHTDHQALTSIMTLKEPKGRLARWQVFLSTFNMDINHRSGKELKDADAISRLCLDDQPKDHEMVNVVVQNGNKRILVKEDQKSLILRRYHDDPDSGGHDGMLRTYLKIKSRFWWPNMKKDVIQYVRSCHDCQVHKSKFKPRPDIMILPNHSKVPFETIHMDFGELTKKGEGRKTTQSFLVIVDEATRYVDTKAMTESSRSVINYLKSRPYLSQIRKIIVDNGKCFDSKEMKAFASDHNINLKFVAPFHPASNGMAERRMRDIKTFVKIYPKFRGGWKLCIDGAAKHINRSYCTSIGCSPFFKLYGKSPSFPADKEFNVPNDLIMESPLTEDQILLKREKMKNYFDSRQVKNIPDIKIGDKVFVQTGFKGKNPNINGPFKVDNVNIMNGFPKTINYTDNNGSQKIATIGNVMKYHQRNDD